LLSIFYKNDLSKAVNGKPKPILLANVTSIIFTNSDLKDFNNDRKNEFKSLNKWLKANRISLKYDENHFMQFTTTNDPQNDTDIAILL